MHEQRIIWLNAPIETYAVHVERSDLNNEQMHHHTIHNIVYFYKIIAGNTNENVRHKLCRVSTHRVVEANVAV